MTRDFSASMHDVNRRNGMAGSSRTMKNEAIFSSCVLDEPLHSCILRRRLVSQVHCITIQMSIPLTILFLVGWYNPTLSSTITSTSYPNLSYIGKSTQSASNDHLENRNVFIPCRKVARRLASVWVPVASDTSAWSQYSIPIHRALLLIPMDCMINDEMKRKNI